MDLTPQQLGRSLYRLGRQLAGRRRFEEARETFALSLQLEPHAADSCFELANLLHAAGRHADAAAQYARAVELDPRFAEAWYNLGVVRMLLRDLGESRLSFERAIAVQPAHAEAHNNLAILMQAAGQLEEALAHYREAARLRPQFLEPRYNLGLALQEARRYEECAAAYADLLKRKHDHVDARNNLANVLLELGRPAEARAAYEKVLRFDPAHPEANWNLGLAQLQTGEWRDGWRNYEWRFRQPSSPPPPLAAASRWDGAPLAGRVILLTCEQGLGDMLQFFRYVPAVAAAGGRVLIECHAPLELLAARLPGVEGTVRKGDAPPRHHCWAPLLSVPHLLGLGPPPADAPYLAADPGRVAHWRRALARSARGRTRVGVTWSGNPQFKANAKRSLAPDDLRALASGHGDGVVLYNLQKGVPQPPGVDLVDLGDDGSSLEDVAAIIANLDLVISVDTSVAHLAGALAKPVWTLLAQSSDWRWMAGRDDSPWYPTMRLFRQSRRGDWNPVVGSVRERLAQFAKP